MINKKKFKTLIIGKGGEIIDNKIFKYRGITYYFYYFIIDSKQWINQMSKSDMRNVHKKDLIECSKYGIIDDHYYKKKKRDRLSILEALDLLGFFLFITWSSIVWCLSHKNKYEDLDARIKKLNLWSLADPMNDTEKKSAEIDNHFKWAFEKIMVNDYARRKKIKKIITLENYMALKKVMTKHNTSSYKN